MSCDIDYRYRRALQPDGLTTFENALRALNEAVDDVRLAGRQVGSCPAVLLLTRHLQRIADGRPTECEADDQALRSQCIERLAELKHRPAIIALVKRGIDARARAHSVRSQRGSGSITPITASAITPHRNNSRASMCWKPKVSMSGSARKGSASRVSPGATRSGNRLAR